VRGRENDGREMTRHSGHTDQIFTSVSGSFPAIEEKNNPKREMDFVRKFYISVHLRHRQKDEEHGDFMLEFM
jgi:hypothetical protein